MATIPLDGLPHEKEVGLPSARVESVATPALLDAGAEQTEKLGTAVTTAGTGIAQVAFQMEQRENADVLFKNEAGDKAAYIAYEADLRANRQGSNAKGAAADTAAWWKDRISKNMEGMNSEQQRLYAKRISDVQFQSIHSVSQFEAHQTEIAHDQSWAADKANTINLAAATPTPGIVATQVAELKRFNSYQAARKGWDAQVLQAENGKDITQLHQQAIQTLAANDPAAAAEYFKVHELEIDGSKRAEIGEFAKKATAAKVGGDAAQAEWAANGPKGDNDASNVDEMAQNIRKQFKNDTFARDAALAQLHQIDAERDKAIKARDSKRTADVNTMLLAGKPLAAVMQTPAWAQLDGTEQQKIKEHQVDRALVAENRAFVREGRDLQRDQRKQAELLRAGYDTMLRVSNPDVLIAMDRNDVINLRTKIGDEATRHLVEKWDAFTKNGTLLSEAKLDNDQFNSFAVKAGLDPNSKSDTDKKLIVETRDRVERLIGSEQQNKKRPLTRDEKDKILQQQIDNTVIQHNTFSFDKSKPAITLPTKEQADAYVLVNGDKVKLSSIPADWRAQMATALRKANIPVTEQTIAERWVTKQQRAKPDTTPPELVVPQ